MVEVLMATYNGAKYLQEQIESILAQTYKDFRIVIRDDGSTDDTILIIKKYVSKYPDKITFVEDNQKCGSSVSNFMQLTTYAKEDYVMYSDQDDYWLPNKIEVTLNKMLEAEEKYGRNIPILVFSTYKPVDVNLNDIIQDASKNQIAKHKTNLSNLLVQNYVTGCLMMINKSLYSIAGDFSKEILMHDWWFALIASAMGEVCYIPECTMLYRQHEGNVVGAVNVKSFKYRIHKIFDKNTKNMKFKYLKQAQLFLERYSCLMDKNNKEIIENFISIYKYDSKYKRMKALIKGRYLKGDLIRILGQLFYI